MSYKDWHPSDLEISIWLKATEGVMINKQHHLIKRPIESTVIVPQHYSNPKQNNELLCHSNIQELYLGDTKNIDHNSVKEIDKGHYRIDSTIDLHGYTLDEAFDSVQSSIINARNENCRLLLFITGRGKKALGNVTINSLFLSWMNSSKIRPNVLRISYANRKHGGDGAFYVLLKRNRQNNDHIK